MSNLQNVIEFATKCHKGQLRIGSGLPYIVHPLSVMTKLLKLGVKDEIVLTAAICHDILEDCPVDSVSLQWRIGTKATDIVEELTFKGINKSAYINSFKDKSIEALLIKILDRVDNIEDFCLSGEGRYAEKYKEKGFPLINFWSQRNSEIYGTFGVGFTEKIKEIWRNV